MPPQASKTLVYPFIPRIVVTPQGNKQIPGPYIFCDLVGPRKTVPIKALVDSGAEGNLFSAVFGHRVGIDLKKGVPAKHKGIGKDNREIKSFGHIVRLQLKEGISIETMVYFSEDQQVNLLGIGGFFDKFQKVSIDASNNVVEIVV